MSVTIRRIACRPGALVVAALVLLVPGTAAQETEKQAEKAARAAGKQLLATARTELQTAAKEFADSLTAFRAVVEAGDWDVDAQFALLDDLELFQDAVAVATTDARTDFSDAVGDILGALDDADGIPGPGLPADFYLGGPILGGFDRRLEALVSKTYRKLDKALGQLEKLLEKQAGVGMSHLVSPPAPLSVRVPGVGGSTMAQKGFTAGTTSCWVTKKPNQC